MLYEKPDFQGRTIALEEGGIELNNVWAEDDAVTEPRDGSPIMIGSIRLAVRVSKNLPLPGGGLQAPPGNCCVYSTVSAGLQHPLHRSVHRAGGPGQDHVLPRRHHRDGRIRHPTEHCLNPGVFWGVSISFPPTDHFSDSWYWAQNKKPRDEGSQQKLGLLKVNFNQKTLWGEMCFGDDGIVLLSAGKRSSLLLTILNLDLWERSLSFKG